jgi:heme exporter protein D
MNHHTIIHAACIIAVVTLTGLLTHSLTAHRATINAHRDYVRQVEIDIADMKKKIEADAIKSNERLSTLERIGVEIHVTDHTGIWLVSGGKAE